MPVVYPQYRIRRQRQQGVPTLQSSRCHNTASCDTAKTMEINLDIKAFVSAAVLVYLIYRYAIYPAFISPLSKIPAAHWSARVSPAWILYMRYCFRENRTVHAAHQKYGDVVRLGPNELSVNCVDDGIRTIYAGGFEKHRWYTNLFSNYDGYDLLTLKCLGFRDLPMTAC